MLTTDTQRVTHGRMDSFFAPIIDRWGLEKLAEALGLPVKNVRRWSEMDSIPAGWFARVDSVGLATIAELLETAERKERHLAHKRALRAAAKHQDAAA